MSLNRYERMLNDYIEANPEEKRFWLARVKETADAPGRREEAVMQLNAMLWDYFEERARHETPFSSVAHYEGSEKISMLNLSEYLLRMWAPPKPKKRA
ncbi:hypothetical protein [Pelagicoccus sp. SDUM812003]|uniref:hypothetical protein n=1 Tax=Pelagicoccus sp. SDUM812003 TaxID=3041267 RepID=UPI00280CD224|nr:hypothetical protein [Pelagicoccus sp. SDUM812003]MDQ8203427.1 hypothetical protein [Pelagicoccus sp. SDUM812003]